MMKSNSKRDQNKNLYLQLVIINKQLMIKLDIKKKKIMFNIDQLLLEQIQYILIYFQLTLKNNENKPCVLYFLCTSSGQQPNSPVKMDEMILEYFN